MSTEALQASVAELEADAARFAWFMSEEPKDGFIMTFMQGARDGWKLSQWRAAIDAARKTQEAT